MMGKTNSKGFTLIEVILFLAITSLMMIGVLVGVNGSISRQRYDDASAGLLDYMKSQYNLVDNVRNNRPLNRACDSSGVAADTEDDGRGTSGCTVVGRLVSSTDGESVDSRPVYALSVPLDGVVSEEDVLDSLDLREAPDDLKTDDVDYTLAWQTQVYTDKDNKSSSRKFTMLIVRLPTNGLTRTYVSDSSVADISELWNAPMTSPLNLCIETSGLTGAPATGVSILPGAANSNGVQFIPAGDGIC